MLSKRFNSFASSAYKYTNNRRRQAINFPLEFGHEDIQNLQTHFNIPTQLISIRKYPPEYATSQGHCILNIKYEKKIRSIMHEDFFLQLPPEINHLIMTFLPKYVYIHIDIKIEYPINYPFGCPIWTLHNISHNINSNMNIEHYYKYIIKKHKDKYSYSTWGPGIDIESDTIDIISKINHFEYLCNDD